MKIVEDYTFTERGAKGKYKELFDEFLALPIGTTVKFTKGEDFETEAKTFSMSLRARIYARGLKARIALREDAVIAQIAGPRVEAAPAEAEKAGSVAAVQKKPATRRTRKPRNAEAASDAPNAVFRSA